MAKRPVKKVATKTKKTAKKTPDIVADKIDVPLVGHDKILAEISRLKQEEITSGAWETWKESQRKLGCDPDSVARPRGRVAGSITAAIFELAVGRPPDRDDLDRCNCGQVGTPGHYSCGWCNECNKPRFMCPHTLSSRVTITVPRRGR